MASKTRTSSTFSHDSRSPDMRKFEMFVGSIRLSTIEVYCYLGEKNPEAQLIWVVVQTAQRFLGRNILASPQFESSFTILAFLEGVLNEAAAQIPKIHRGARTWNITWHFKIFGILLTKFFLWRVT